MFCFLQQASINYERFLIWFPLAWLFFGFSYWRLGLPLYRVYPLTLHSSTASCHLVGEHAKFSSKQEHPQALISGPTQVPFSITRPQTADRQQKEVPAVPVLPTMAISRCQRSQEPSQEITSERHQDTDPTCYQSHARPGTEGGENRFGGAFLYSFLGNKRKF